jgi:hypothetical protein
MDLSPLPGRRINMTLTRNALSAFALVALTAAAPRSGFAAEALYAQTTTQSYTTFIGPIPIDGLSLNLPVATTAYNAAIVTLNLPNLTLSQPTSKTEKMAAQFQIVAPFSPAGLVSASGAIGCDTVGINNSGTKPLTIVLEVPLGTTSQPVEGEWSSTGGTVTTETFASISAILVRN